jgi:DNA (cytosine-5)-methyltransferase 1
VAYGRPIAVDLFCGAGGLSEGLRMAGFEVALAVDSNPDAYLVYSRNHRDTMTLWTDIKQIKNFQVLLKKAGVNYREVQLVVGGPPCQGFSVANTKNRGPRNGKVELFEFLRAVKEIHPAAFVMENVVGLTSIDEGEMLKGLISKFEGLGYTVKRETVNAANYGVPQNRRRVLLIGSLGKGVQGPPQASHGLESPHAYVTVGDALLGDLPSLNPTTGKPVSKYLRDARTTYQRKIRGKCPALYDHVVTASSEIVKKRFRLIKPGQSLVDLVKEGKVPCELLIKIDHKSVYRRLDSTKPSVTVSNFRKSMLIHPTEDRLLSLREAARLQSFPDRYRFPGLIQHMQQVLGDAVPPLLARAIVRPLLEM